MDNIFFERPVPSLMKKDGMGMVDMHFHTEASFDSLARIGNVVARMRKEGIGCVVCDHNEIRGAKLMSKIENVLFIPSIEVTSHEGIHITPFFSKFQDLEHFYRKVLMKGLMQNPFWSSLSAFELLEKGREYNAVVGVPHMFIPGSAGLGRLEIEPDMERKIDTVEVINGYNLRHLNEKAITWAYEHGKAVTGGSDGHFTVELGNVVTMAEGTTPETFLESVRKNRATVIGKENKMILSLIKCLEKEVVTVRRDIHKHENMQHLQYQLSVEYDDLVKVLRKDERRFLELFTMHHGY